MSADAEILDFLERHLACLERARVEQRRFALWFVEREEHFSPDEVFQFATMRYPTVREAVEAAMKSMDKDGKEK